MLEQGTLAGVRIEANPEPATQISAMRGTENDPCWARFRKPARRFGMSMSTIRRWMETGRLEAF